jgi:hypothetical protein
MNQLDTAITLQLKLVAAMRRVRDTCPRWWSEERIRAAQEADLECQALLAETENAWDLA